MSYMEDLLNGLGVKVYVATDISKEALVYDSDAPSKKSSGGLPIDYKIRITSRSGKEIVSYGEAKFNPLKVAAIFGVGLAGLFIVAKGLKGSYVQFKKRG